MKIARELMTTRIETVTADTRIEVLARLFTQKRVSGFPVVDEAGALIGVVTESDLIHRDERLHIPTVFTLFDAVISLGGEKRFEEELKRLVATTVGEIMTREPITVSPEATTSDIATIMGEHRAHTLPVVDGEGVLVGVLGKIDLIKAMR